MATAIIFPGQGSQAVGMGKDLMSTKASEYFRMADEYLGYELSRLMFDGPEDELRLTKNTQPALLTHSIALWSLMKDKVRPSYFAGHSLGEYTALVAAGGLDFEDAVRAVNRRGIYMQEAVPVGTGGMLAVLGADDRAIEAVCAEVSMKGSVVEPANYNCAGQVVVAGETKALERFTVMMKERGAKRIIPLPVSAPFHSSLMQPARERMAEYLVNIKISPLHTPVVNNVDVAVESEPSVVLDSLVRQITGAVRWSQLVQKLISMGITRFIEVGQGSVLTGLVKKTDKDVETMNVSTLEDIGKL